MTTIIMVGKGLYRHPCFLLSLLLLLLLMEPRLPLLPIASLCRSQLQALISPFHTRLVGSWSRRLVSKMCKGCVRLRCTLLGCCRM
jgi:hypothetical protein